jgi:hypothetical protein
MKGTPIHQEEKPARTVQRREADRPDELKVQLRAF